MRLLDLIPRVSAQASAPVNRDAFDDRWFTGAGARSEIRVNVTVDRARQVPVVRDCLHTIAESVAGLKHGVFRRVDGHSTVRVDNHPIAVLLGDPNKRMTGFEFMQTLVDDLCAWGDFYAELMFDARGNVAELRRIEPGCVRVEELPDWSKRFIVNERGRGERRLLDDEVWHIPLPPLVDNLKGTSPILKDGLEACAVAIALQQYANALFTNDATPNFALVMPVGQEFADQASKDNFLRAWARRVTGANRHRPAILEKGIEPKRLGLTAEESQFLETRKELWLDLTRIWRVPPHKVGIMDRATFSNIEHQSLEFVTDTLRPILELIEASVNKYLLQDRSLFFQFDVSSLLRGDIKARYEAYALGRQWGWLSVNDVLHMENRNGIGRAGDRYMEPLNMVPVGTGADQRSPAQQAGVQSAVAFLRSSVQPGGKPRLELIRHAA